MCARPVFPCEAWLPWRPSCIGVARTCRTFPPPQVVLFGPSVAGRWTPSLTALTFAAGFCRHTVRALAPDRKSYMLTEVALPMIDATPSSPVLPLPARPLRSLTAADYVFIAADYSQIEVRLMYVSLPMRERAWQCGGGRARTPRLRCRVVVSSVVNHPHMCVPACVRSPQLKLGRAHLCGDRSLCELFHGSGDVYASLAAHVFSVPTRAVSPVQRKQAKVVALGILYGIGAPEVAKQVRTSRACV